MAVLAFKAEVDSIDLCLRIANDIRDVFNNRDTIFDRWSKYFIEDYFGDGDNLRQSERSQFFEFALTAHSEVAMYMQIADPHAAITSVVWENLSFNWESSIAFRPPTNDDILAELRNVLASELYRMRKQLNKKDKSEDAERLRKFMRVRYAHAVDQGDTDRLLDFVESFYTEALRPQFRSLMCSTAGVLIQKKRRALASDLLRDALEEGKRSKQLRQLQIFDFSAVHWTASSPSDCGISNK